MKVEYTLTPEDVAVLSHHQLEKEPSARAYRALTLFMWIAVIVVIIFLVGVLMLLVDRRKDPTLIIVLIAVCLASFALYLWLVYRMIPRGMAKALCKAHEKLLREPLKLEISPEGITNKAAGIATVISWSAVHHITMTEDYAFIFLESQNAVVIPKRAFEASQGFEDFVETCRVYLSQATAI